MDVSKTCSLELESRGVPGGAAVAFSGVTLQSPSITSDIDEIARQSYCRARFMPIWGGLGCLKR
jgi:hypothetical protein